MIEQPKPVSVPRPPQSHHDISPWIDEQIWGHRLWDAQTPWLLFLEFLNVAEACHRQGKLFDEGGVYYPLAYQPYKRMFLRNILFNSEFLTQLANESRDPATLWKDWLKWMENKAKAVPHTDFSYLQRRFRSFRDFASLVATMRSSTVESQTNRRWTSRFVFPFGPHALYEDLNISPAGTATREYVNFGRTGELLYLMICRSENASSLRDAFATVFDSSSQWDSLAKIFQPGPDQEMAWRGKSYLPYLEHPVFNLLGQDWQSIFDLRLPGYDAFEHLVTLGTLHVMLYQLQVASKQAQPEASIYFICEAIAPKKTLVRELSATNFQDNSALSTRAVERYIANLEESDAWRLATTNIENSEEAFQNCLKLLEKEVWWGGDYTGQHNPVALIAELKDESIKRHRRHVGNIHRVYGREIGLVSKRGTVKLRYAPTDSLLKTLLLANVPKRMELGQFLATLYSRYGIVFGDLEAGKAIDLGTFEKKVLRQNVQRLEQRLSSLGMLRRLSDTCAYVENPHTRKIL